MIINIVGNHLIEKYQSNKQNCINNIIFIISTYNKKYLNSEYEFISHETKLKMSIYIFQFITLMKKKYYMDKIGV